MYRQLPALAVVVAIVLISLGALAVADGDVVAGQSNMTVGFSDQQLDNGTVVIEGVDSDGVDNASVFILFEDRGTTFVSGVSTTESSWNMTNVSVTLDFTPSLPGSYTAAILSTENASTDYQPGDELSNSTAAAFVDQDTATIEEPPGPPVSNLSGLDIAGQGSNATITEGENKSVSVDVENIGEQSGSFTVSLDIAFATDPPSASDDVEAEFSGTKSTTELAPGESETVVFESVTGDLISVEYVVTADTDNDSVSGDLTVEEPDSAQPNLSGLDIAGQGQNATIVEGNSTNVSIDVENVGEQSGSFNITLSIADEVSDELSTAELAPGETETVIFESVTGNLETGEYTVVTSGGNSTASGGLSVEGPVSNLSNLDIADQGAEATIVAGENMAVSTTVENVGDIAGSFNITLAISDSVQVTKSTTELTPNDTETVAFENVTGDLDPAEYSVVVSSDDDQLSGTLVVESGGGEPALSNLNIAGQGTNATIIEGDTENVSVDIENIGETPGTFQINLTIGETVAESVSTAELDPGQNETVTFVGVTSGLNPANYDVDVSTATDTLRGNLTVEAAVESALSTLNIAGQGASATIDEGVARNVSVVVENVGVQSGSFNITLDIGSAVTETQSTGELASGATETVTFKNVTSNLGAAEYSVDLSTANDTTSGTLVVEATAEFLVDIVETNTPVEGESLTVTTQVQNPTDTEDTQTIELTVGELGTNTTTLTLSGFELVTETLSIDTSSGDAGEYTAVVVSEDDQDSENVTVDAAAEPSLSALDIAGQGTDATITEGDDENVSVVVENVGDGAGSFDVTLGIGSTVDQTQSTGNLAAGANTTVVFAGVTGGLSAGGYSVDLSTADDATSGSLTVQAPAASSLSGLDIAGQGTIATLPADSRDAHNIEINVTNIGDQTGSFDVTLDIGDAVSRTTSTAELASGQTETVVFQDVTANLTIGTYTVSVSTAEDAASGTLTIEALVGLRFPEQNVTTQSEVAVGNVSSEGAALLLVTYEEGGDTVVAGVANGTFDGNNVTVTLEEDFGFPEQYTAHLLPASEASGNYTPGDTLSSNTSSAVVVSQTARVTTVTGAPDVVVANAPAKDTTGDGLLDDVRGDGSLDILDVQTLFSSRDDPVIEDNAEFFNFQSGSTPVSIFDIQALFSIYQQN